MNLNEIAKSKDIFEKMKDIRQQIVKESQVIEDKLDNITKLSRELMTLARENLLSTLNLKSNSEDDVKVGHYYIDINSGRIVRVKLYTKTPWKHELVDKTHIEVEHIHCILDNASSGVNFSKEYFLKHHAYVEPGEMLRYLTSKPEIASEYCQEIQHCCDLIKMK